MNRNQFINLLSFSVLFSSVIGDENQTIVNHNSEYILQKFYTFINVPLLNPNSDDVKELIENEEVIKDWIERWGKNEFEKVKGILLYLCQFDKLAQVIVDQQDISSFTKSSIEDIFLQYIGDADRISAMRIYGGIHFLLKSRIIDPIVNYLYGEEVNELFNGGRITKALKKDLDESSEPITDTELSHNNSITLKFHNEEFKADNILDAVDCILTKVKFEIKENKFNYKLVDLNEISKINLENIAKEYDLDNVYLGLPYSGKSRIKVSIQRKEDINLYISTKEKIDSKLNKLQRFGQFINDNYKGVYKIATISFDK